MAEARWAPRVLINGPCEHSFSSIFWAWRAALSTEGTVPFPVSASWLPTLGSGVQEDQVYILILRKLCLSSPGPFQLKGERKRRVSWAKKGNLTHTAQNQVMSLWALCTVATINTWKAFDSHISKTRHKAHASLFPQTGPHGRGGGAVTKAPFSSGKAVLIRPPRGDITESLHRNEGSYSIRSQRPLREGLLEHRSPEGQQKCVSQTTLFYREGNWHLRWGFSLAKWIFVYHVSDNNAKCWGCSWIPNFSSFRRDCQSWTWYQKCSIYECIIYDQMQNSCECSESPIFKIRNSKIELCTHTRKIMPNMYVSWPKAS